VKLQKTRRYLLNLKLKLKDLQIILQILNQIQLHQINDSSNFKKNKRIKIKIRTQKVGFNQRRFRPKLTKQELRRQRLIKNV
jgi:hypothetical protein